MKSSPNNLSVSAVIAAGGKGLRAGFDKNKLLVDVCGAPLKKTAKLFDIPDVSEIVIAISGDDLSEAKELLKDIHTPIIFAAGGGTRFLSVKNALDKVTGDIVLIHDGARCFCPSSVIKSCIDSVKNHGSGICAIPSVDTACIAKGGEITDSLDRNTVYNIQTPQGFLTKDIKRAYSLAEGDFTDDSSVYLKYIGRPKIVIGDKSNIKLTFKEDFKQAMEFFTGTGFDVHAFAEGRDLILGGERISCEKGLLGHSDADVLTHAICDALLSAAGLNDIGFYFPDTDPKYKGVSSLKLLGEVVCLIGERGFAVHNISAVIIAQSPKLSPYIDRIKANLSKVIHISTDLLGITATTTEKLGFTGRGEGIAVNASVMLKK